MCPTGSTGWVCVQHGHGCGRRRRKVVSMCVQTGRTSAAVTALGGYYVLSVAWVWRRMKVVSIAEHAARVCVQHSLLTAASRP